MPALLVVVLEIMVLFLAAWFAFWLIDHIGFPDAPPAPPFKVFFQVIIVIIFLVILLGLFGVYGTYWHPALFR